MATKLLLVDDDRTLLQALSRFLQDNEFYVLNTPDSLQAMDLLDELQPEIVLMDVSSESGWEACAQLRADHPDLPLILMSTSASEEDKLRGLRMGADDFLTKPVDRVELLARVFVVLGRARYSANAARDQVVFGDLVVDMENHQVRRRDDVIALTPTEFRLLAYLANHRGQAISEAELAREVWGSDSTEETTTVRRYIWLLRQKIEPDPSAPHVILTVRGMGYRIGTGALRDPMLEYRMGSD